MSPSTVTEHAGPAPPQKGEAAAREEPEGRDELLAELQRSVRRYQRDIDRFDQALAEQLGLNRTDLRCVDLLFDEPMSAGRLAAHAGVTPAAVTTIIDRLTRSGYARRRPHPEDRRRVDVELTPKLLRRVADLLGPYVEEAIHETDGYTDEELSVVCRWLAESHRRRTVHTERLATAGPPRPKRKA
ncbi:MAG: MarR family winged helix-turn-helix transcriptional regulator [Solirubrobacteraceae bacterium]